MIVVAECIANPIILEDCIIKVIIIICVDVTPSLDLFIVLFSGTLLRYLEKKCLGFVSGLQAVSSNLPNSTHSHL